MEYILYTAIGQGSKRFFTIYFTEEAAKFIERSVNPLASIAHSGFSISIDQDSVIEFHGRTLFFYYMKIPEKNELKIGSRQAEKIRL